MHSSMPEVIGGDFLSKHYLVLIWKAAEILASNIYILVLLSTNPMSKCEKVFMFSFVHLHLHFKNYQIYQTPKSHNKFAFMIRFIE